MLFSDENFFYTFRLLIEAIKKKVVGGEDLLHRLVFGEYQYECKGDHKSDRYVVMNVFMTYKILNPLYSLYSHNADRILYPNVILSINHILM